jgi:hypothetical protein
MSASITLRSLLLCICLLACLVPLSDADAFETKSTSPFSALQDLVGQDWGSSQLSDFGRDPRNIVSLIDYLRSNLTTARRVPEYDRLSDFGGWAYPDSQTCRNTRAHVLVRDADSKTEIKYTNGSECSVATGLWHDPYTGRDFRRARDLDIDHVVPLHHAWLTGAARWKPDRRCHYANFMKNSIHLLAVSSSENRMKGDRGPDSYMPPNSAEQCTYLTKWMMIKTIWQLTATASEVQAIEQTFATNNCPAQSNFISATDLQQQRDLSDDTIPVCVGFHGQSFDPPGRQQVDAEATDAVGS